MENTIKIRGNEAKILDKDEKPSTFVEPTEIEKELISFVIDHTDRWRDYRDQNYSDDIDKYDRIFRGIWSEEDKLRSSERSRVISPATQQAIETRHAEIMEAIFGQGEYFDIKDDLKDVNGNPMDIEILKNQLKEDFAQDKIRKSIDQIVLLGEISGTGIGEIHIGEEKVYKPAFMPFNETQIAYGQREEDRFYVRLAPVNLKNFLWDPNGTTVDDCMGVAIERNISIHKIASGIESKKYRKVDISSFYKDDSLEPTQEAKNYQDDKVTLLTYYGLVPRETLSKLNENVVKLFDDELDDYSDMVEAIVIIGNGELLLKAEESPYTMKDRPVLTYQADTVPNRLPGRGTAEKSYNMQCAIDGSMRNHLDSLALTTAPMMGLDATRLPRGAKFQVSPGKNFMVNGNPQEIMFPFKFGQTDGQAMETSKEFERMLLMATGTIDSNGQVSQVSRDGNMDMATATLIKKYKRVLVNFQEDFLIPFIYKATWRYMQYNPERYPSVDVKFLPTATLGIIAREYEQKQLAFLVQTLGAQSPVTPILMQGILENSSLSNKQAMIQQMKQMSQPDPEQQKLQQQSVMLEIQGKQADITQTNAETQKIQVETQLAPDIAKAKIISALSNNLDEDNEGKDFERRARIADLMLKERDIDSNENIAKVQMSQSADDKQLKYNEQKLKMEEHEMKKKEHEMKKEELALKKKGRKITAPSGDTYSVE